MSLPWPPGFARIPAEDWAERPVESLALKYDSVENHGWYANLDPTVEAVAEAAGDGALVVDYSGGTGIFADRLLRRLRQRPVGILIADSSPKFLRLAVEKFRHEPRVALRLIAYLKPEGRLQLLEEALDGALVERGAEVIVSTNAIHLYYDLPETLASWRRVVRGDGRVFVQSGNLRNPDAPADAWIIDETVGYIHRAAVDLVGLDPAFARFQRDLDDPAHMEAHQALRDKVFLPVRDLGHYTAALATAGFEVVASEHRAVEARVDEWYEFLAVYHEGVLGWAGGAEKVTGRAPAEDVVAARKELLRAAMERVFDGRESFSACWTYLTCAPV